MGICGSTETPVEEAMTSVISDTPSDTMSRDEEAAAEVSSLYTLFTTP